MKRCEPESENWLEVACDAYLDQCANPEVLAIVIRDAPRVLPPRQFKDIDHEANAPLVVGLLRSAVENGTLKIIDIELTARLLGGAFEEAGKIIAETPPSERSVVRSRIRTVMLSWLAATNPS